MTNDAPSGQETRGTDLKTTVCDDGRHIMARNARSGSGDVHTVSLGLSGDVTGCSCPGWTHNRTCYHVDHVRNSPLLLSSARAKAAAGQRVATDGGEELTDGEESDLPAIEDMADDPHRRRCAGCGRTGPIDIDDEAAILHARECPRSDNETERAACDECGAAAETRFDADIHHAADCPNASGVVDPYADEHEEVDETPL